ncbi:MAG: VanZ family protein [Pseudomonadota bacterium]|nr:VanZ family protein [Pseudomonadota bacterium]
MLIKAARIIAWLLIAAAIFLSIGPQKFRPYTGIEHELEHFLAFAVIGLAFGLGYPGRGLTLAMLGIAIAGALETAQLWVPHRHAYFSDFLVNGSAVCFGIAAAACLNWIIRRYTVSRRSQYR